MISILLLLLAGASRGLSELVGFKHSESIFSGKANPVSFWGSQSWRRKYKTRLDMHQFYPAPKNWYYKIFSIEYKERFLLSATTFSWLTDGFHMCNTLMRMAIVGSCVFADWQSMAGTPYIAAIVLAYLGAWHVGFHLTYSWIFRKR